MEAFNKGDVGVNLDGVHGRIHQGAIFFLLVNLIQFPADLLLII